MKKLVPVLKITRNQSVLAFLLFFWTQNPHADPLPNKIQGDEVYVIVNPANSQHSITQNGLNAIFNMRLRSWSDGSPITVFVLPDEDPLHKKFCKQKLDVFPHQLRRGWNRLVFSGTGQAPTQLENEMDMLKHVSETPGSVGYLSGKDLTSAVKLLEID